MVTAGTVSAPACPTDARTSVLQVAKKFASEALDPGHVVPAVQRPGAHEPLCSFRAHAAQAGEHLHPGDVQVDAPGTRNRANGRTTNRACLLLRARDRSGAAHTWTASPVGTRISSVPGVQ